MKTFVGDGHRVWGGKRVQGGGVVVADACCRVHEGCRVCRCMGAAVWARRVWGNAGVGVRVSWMRQQVPTRVECMSGLVGAPAARRRVLADAAQHRAQGGVCHHQWQG